MWSLLLNLNSIWDIESPERQETCLSWLGLLGWQALSPLWLALFPWLRSWTLWAKLKHSSLFAFDCGYKVTSSSKLLWSPQHYGLSPWSAKQNNPSPPWVIFFPFHAWETKQQEKKLRQVMSLVSTVGEVEANLFASQMAKQEHMCSCSIGNGLI